MINTLQTQAQPEAHPPFLTPNLVDAATGRLLRLTWHVDGPPGTAPGVPVAV